MYRSVCKAHESIIEGKGLWESGTTTLLISVLVELEDSPLKYGLISANVGDCKCFHYSKKDNIVNEVTRNVRQDEVNMNDPGKKKNQIKKFFAQFFCFFFFSKKKNF